MEKKGNCILNVKFSYVRFILQVWKYVYDTFNLLFTSHLNSRLYEAPPNSLIDSTVSLEVKTMKG